MPAKKRKVSAKKFVDLIDAITLSYGLDEDIVIEALKKAFAVGYRNNVKQKDVLVKVDINKKKGEINIYNQKTVVDEVFDDFLEISLEDARETQPKIQLGELFDIKEDLDELNRNASNLIVKEFQRFINEELRNNVYNKFHDKEGEMVIGEVEVVDPKLTLVKIDGVSADMPLREQIPGEYLRPGDLVKVYIKEVSQNNKGSQLLVSRSDYGLLKRLFEDEITEIYDGIVEIRSIAREPGDRAKVAVSSRDTNIDAPGACIGQKGSRIQKITAGLHNEKIDVIQYYDEPELYIAEALKPANVYGLELNYETKSAIAVVANEDYSVAIGQKGINARLAVKLTGWRIDIKTVDEALNLGIQFKSLTNIKRSIEESKQAAILDEIKSTSEQLDLDTDNDLLSELTELTEEPIIDEVIEETVEDSLDKTKTTKKSRGLESLMESSFIPQAELELEQIKKEEKEEKQQVAPKKKKVAKEEPVKTDTSNYMPVYTDEELEALEEEENEESSKYDEDVDYDEYDEYYE